jgi:O-antigen biosynthesis protein
MTQPRMKLWHLMESYAPDYGGGAAIVTREVCRLLAERGHEVRVLCIEKAAGPEYAVRTDFDGPIRVDRVNLPYFKAEDPEGWRLGLRRWRAHEHRVAGLLDELLDNWRPDLANYQTVRPLGEECLFSLARRGIPVVATLHDAWLICPRVMLLRSPDSQPCPGPSPARCLACLYSQYDGCAQACFKLPWRLLKLGAYPAYRLRRRFQARRCVAGALACSEFMAEKHRPHLPGSVRHIPFGINLTGLPNRRPERPRPVLRFGFVAGFQPSKGIEDVLTSAASLKQDGLPFELHVWGPEQGQGAARLAAHGLEDRVFLRGMFRPEQRWEVYGEMDVAIMATTVCEPLGLVPLEAGATGAATIAPAVGGIVESIRHDFDGLLYGFRDVENLKRQMRRVLVEPDLVGRLMNNLSPPLDSRESVAEVEAFCLSLLGRSPFVDRPVPKPLPLRMIDAAQGGCS